MISQNIDSEKFTATNLTCIFLISMGQKVLIHITPARKNLEVKNIDENYSHLPKLFQ